LSRKVAEISLRSEMAAIRKKDFVNMAVRVEVTAPHLITFLFIA